jgi:hypothetical protein
MPFYLFAAPTPFSDVLTPFSDFLTPFLVFSLFVLAVPD